MHLCYTLAVWLRTIFNTRNVVLNLERSNTFMGYGTIQSDGKLSFMNWATTSKGYITKSKFHKDGITFVKYLNDISQLDWNLLLIIDSHKSHVYNLAFFDEMWENNINITTIPPHTSHIIQPLDLTPFAQFKRNWQYHLLECNTAHSAKVLAKKHFW